MSTMTWPAAIRKSFEISNNSPMTPSAVVAVIRTHNLREVTGETPEATVGARMSTDKVTYERVSPNTFRPRTASNPYVAPAAIDPETPSAEALITFYGLMWTRKDTLLRKELLVGSVDGDLEELDGTKGVYFLYHDETLVYVGRVTDRTIAKRLDEHTKGPLGHRWNKFSFFLFNDTELQPEVVTAGIEALLLEVLNPQCNRACGQLRGGTEVLPA